MCVDKMKSFPWSLLYCASLLLSDALGTYHHQLQQHHGAGDPHLIAAQSYAQTRNNGRPPQRTLNPSSRFLLKLLNTLFTPPEGKIQLVVCSSVGGNSVKLVKKHQSIIVTKVHLLKYCTEASADVVACVFLFY